MSEYYQLKYYVTESFYEFIVAENYTVNQAVGRCLDDFWRQISHGGLPALTVYSALFSRAAFHKPETLKRCQREIEAMNRLFTPEIRSALTKEELEELTDDVDMINQKLK